MSDVESPQAPQVERLDQYIVKKFPGLSRAAAVRLIEDGKVTRNGKIADKAGQKVIETDLVQIDYDPSVQPEIPEIDLPVLYEDRSCVVINKPLGVLSHSKGAFNPEATVATWLAGRIQGMSGERAGIVHRLDRATSGVMICAKTSKALSWLQKQFSERNVKKTYIAIVEGAPPKEQAVIDMPIERNPKKPQTFRVGANGKPSTTAYRIIRENKKYSLLELQPATGRTHQLRVHLSQIGHPILGDVLYGGDPADRLFLHAYKLEITLPSRERKVFEAPVPEVFEGVMQA